MNTQAKETRERWLAAVRDSSPQHLECEAELRYSNAKGDWEGLFEAIVSTPAIDAHGTSIDPAGIDLGRFRKNPVLMWSHSADRMPVGRCVSIALKGKALVASCQLDMDETSGPEDSLARQIFWKIKRGFVRAMSIGFFPREVRFEERDGVEIAVISRSELLEVSIVAAGSNPDALIDTESTRSIGGGAGFARVDPEEQRDLDVIARYERGEGVGLHELRGAERREDQRQRERSRAGAVREVTARSAQLGRDIERLNAQFEIYADEIDASARGSSGSLETREPEAVTSDDLAAAFEREFAASYGGDL